MTTDPTTLAREVIDHNHPAIEAAAERFRAEMMGPSWARPWAELGERAKRKWRTRALAALAVALPRLPADDLRNTPTGQALLAEGWEACAGVAGDMAVHGMIPAHDLAAHPNPYLEDDQ